MNPLLTFKATTAHDRDAVCAWCEQQFGVFNEGWYRLGSDPLSAMLAEIEGTPARDIYYFANEQDQALFVLRWS